MRRISNTTSSFLILLWSSLIMGCATLTNPVGPNSSLVIGRVVINNQYLGAFGSLSLGTIKHGIKVEIESKDGSQFVTAITYREGYFVIPNIPPSAYYLSRLRFEEEIGITLPKGPFFAPIPGEIVNLGTFMIDISKNFDVTTKYRKPNPEAAKAHLSEKYPGTPWLTRDFTTAHWQRSQENLIRR